MPATLNANLLQAEEIRRYHRHLLRAGGDVSLESAARQWIGRYSRLWREHFTTRRSK